jgi:hypothetical protein
MQVRDLRQRLTSPSSIDVGELLQCLLGQVFWIGALGGAVVGLVLSSGLVSVVGLVLVVAAIVLDIIGTICTNVGRSPINQRGEQ